MEEAFAVMAALNRPAAEAMQGFTIHAATDITGYGLLGHAYEMMDASGTTGSFRFRAFLSCPRRGAWPLAGSRPTAPGSTSETFLPGPRAESGVTDDDFLLLCDAQTSGGLLVALPESEAERYVAECRQAGSVIGSGRGSSVAEGREEVEGRLSDE